MTKMKGAPAALDRLRASFASIADNSERGWKLAKYNGDHSRDRFDEILEIVRDALKQVEVEIEPLLERQATSYEKRLKELEDWKAAIEAEQHGVLRMRKAE